VAAAGEPNSNGAGREDGGRPILLPATPLPEWRMHGHDGECAVHLSPVLVCVPVALHCCCRWAAVGAGQEPSTFSLFSLSFLCLAGGLSRFGFVKVGKARKQQRTNQKGDAMMDHHRKGCFRGSTTIQIIS
jgi:hypothetical protein